MRLGNQADLAAIYHQLGSLEATQGRAGPSIAWYVRALTAGRRSNLWEPAVELRRLSKARSELGSQEFTRLLIQAAGSREAKEIASLLEQLGADDSGKGS
jgi:hypothetical protein